MKQCKHGVLLYGRHCIQCEREREKTLDQLTCDSCGDVFHAPQLGSDQVRFGAICDNCKPKPTTVTIRSFRIVDRKIIDGESDEQISKR